MSLQFPYLPVPLGGPPPPTLPPGAASRWRPLIPVRVSNPDTGTFRDFDRVLADSGADDTIFPMGLARTLGIVLLPDSSGGHTIVWGGSRHPIRYGDVSLEVSDGASTLCWTARVAFTPATLRYPLLGQTGFLQHLDALFRTADRLLLLEPASSFSGSRT